MEIKMKLKASAIFVKSYIAGHTTEKTSLPGFKETQ